jgi:hypothetical protein
MDKGATLQGFYTGISRPAQRLTLGTAPLDPGKGDLAFSPRE